MTVFALREKNTKQLFTESMIHRYRARATPKFYATIGVARRRWSEVQEYQTNRVSQAKQRKEYFIKTHTQEEFERYDKDGCFDNFKPFQFEIVEFELKEVRIRDDYRWQEYKKTVLALESLE